MQAFISFFLAIVMAFGASTGYLYARDGVADAAEEAMVQAPVVQDESAPVQAADEQPETDFGIEEQSASAPRDGADWADMKYAHYDAEYFYAMVDELSNLAGDDDADGIIDLYDRLYGEIVKASTYQSIAYIRSSADVLDEYWTEESIYADTLIVDMADTMSTACYEVTQGPCADAFAEHIGSDAADFFAGYVPMTDRETELVARETTLVNEYYELMNGADDVVYTYLGEDWTWDKFEGFPGTSLYYDDYDGYLEVYYGLLEQVNAMVGPIYVELVRLRAEIAGIEGYESYADMAYEQDFGRDYTTADAQIFCDQVKGFAAQYYNDL